VPLEPIAPAAVLVLDFDGTVYVGDAAVWAYAEAVIEDTAAAPRFAERLRLSLTRYLGGEGGDYRDGYDAVAELSADVVSEDALQAAYLASRQALVDGSLPVTAPDGLAEFLRSLGGHVERVLVTNAPRDGVAETLDRLGLSRVIDRIEPNAQKPSGFSTLLPTLLAGRPANALLSVGDIWANDIQPPLEFGCATAFIDRFGAATGPSQLRGATFPELYPGIAEWAADPAAFATRHPLAPEHIDGHEPSLS
jgi:FMN phosphatase YigB (HAD superfamily)